MTVYLVDAEYGEYDDHDRWNVAIFKEEKDAQEFIDKINVWIQISSEYGKECPYDPQYRCGCYGVSQYGYAAYTVQ